MKFLLIRLAALAVFLPALPTATGMELGTNFWNLKWHAANDCFKDVKNVTETDPWNPQFLKETSIYSCFRFMDWDATNGTLRKTWTERPQKSAPDQTTAAYEWMIDLCNRQNADMWVCIPHPSIDRNSGDEPCDYAIRLCLLVKTGVDMKSVNLKPMQDRLATLTADDLIKTGGVKACEPLKPSLKLYVEYSNETWNGSFKQSHYCVEEGTALKLDPKGQVGNDGKIWANGFKFHAWAALRAFRAADLVFGAGSPRVVRVLALQQGSSTQARMQLEICNSKTFNPWGVKPDAFTIAPYFGRKVPGDDPEVVQKLREAMMENIKGIESVKAVAEGEKMKLIAYEGGQHVLKNAKAINTRPEMFDLYTQYFDQMSKYFSLFCHYAHVGRASDKGAWGAIQRTGEPLNEAHKYRALVEWRKAHPREGLEAEAVKPAN